MKVEKEEIKIYEYTITLTHEEFIELYDFIRQYEVRIAIKLRTLMASQG